jgi:hypothetical protein
MRGEANASGAPGGALRSKKLADKCNAELVALDRAMVVRGADETLRTGGGEGLQRIDREEPSGAPTELNDVTRWFPTAATNYERSWLYIR